MAFGCLGILVEVVFTGLHNLLVKKDIRAISRTYLWMFPIYGAGGTLLEYTRQLLGDTNFILRALLYTVLIFGMEFFWGAVLQALLGKCPWKYMDPDNDTIVHRFSVMGFIRLDYMPYWFLLSVLFDSSSSTIQAVINGASRL